MPIRNHLVTAVLCLAALSACGGGGTVKPTSQKAVDGEPVYVASVVPFAENTHVRQAVRSQCDLGVKLSRFVQTYGREYNTNVVAGNQPEDNSRRLEIKIIDVHGPGGGAWSGAKSVAVEGELIEGDEVVGSFRGSRYSGGGLFGGFKGTCSILGRCVEALGEDIARWLQAPVMNASLGDGY